MRQPDCVLLYMNTHPDVQPKIIFSLRGDSIFARTSDTNKPTRVYCDPKDTKAIREYIQTFYIDKKADVVLRVGDKRKKRDYRELHTYVLKAYNNKRLVLCDTLEWDARADYHEVTQAYMEVSKLLFLSFNKFLDKWTEEQNIKPKSSTLNQKDSLGRKTGKWVRVYKSYTKVTHYKAGKLHGPAYHYSVKGALGGYREFEEGQLVGHGWELIYDRMKYFWRDVEMNFNPVVFDEMMIFAEEKGGKPYFVYDNSNSNDDLFVEVDVETLDENACDLSVDFEYSTILFAEYMNERTGAIYAFDIHEGYLIDVFRGFVSVASDMSLAYCWPYDFFGLVGCTGFYWLEHQKDEIIVDKHIGANSPQRRQAEMAPTIGVASTVLDRYAVTKRLWLCDEYGYRLISDVDPERPPTNRFSIFDRRDGIWLWHNGATNLEISYNDGVLDGGFKETDADGNLFFTGRFKESIPGGYWYHFAYGGKIDMIFSDFTVLKNKRVSCMFHRYNEQGELIEKCKLIWDMKKHPLETLPYPYGESLRNAMINTNSSIK